MSAFCALLSISQCILIIDLFLIALYSASAYDDDDVYDDDEI